MTEAKKSMPKGGRKGGSTFPRISLERAIEYSSKLVSKTHTGPQPAEIIFVGVFNTKSSDADIRASALKQYGLMEGKSAGYFASDLAKQIISAPQDERPTLLMQACLRPKIFDVLYRTFSGDTVTNAKIRQQVLNQNVHPDSADECVETFVQSLTFAGFATSQSDGAISLLRLEKNLDENKVADEEKNSLLHEKSREGTTSNLIKSSVDGSIDRKSPHDANVHVTITLDSTMDSEKLERQLRLLKEYGAL